MPAADLPLPFALPALLDGPSRAPVAAAPHLILPYAAAENAPAVATPQLDALLALLQETERDGQEYDFPIPPHERAVAQAWGLNAAAPAWAAVGATALLPHAWLTPCHLHAGADQVRLNDPAQLQFTLAEAQALCAILAPWWAEDGLQLQVLEPLLWRVSGAPLAGLSTASLDRVLLRDASRWLPQTQPFQRLHSEAQMLLYSHPFNDAREAQGLPAVNSFWVHGTGALPAGLTAPAQPPQVADALRAPALREDWRAWASAWATLDAGPVADLLRQAEQGQPVRLTLSGEHSAQSFHTAPLGLVQRIQRFLRPQRFMDVREQL